MVAADAADNSPCRRSPTPPVHRNRNAESARSAHICKLPGSTLRQDSCIFGPLHHRKNRGRPRKWEMTHTPGNGQRTFLAYPWPKYKPGFLLANCESWTRLSPTGRLRSSARTMGRSLRHALIDPRHRKMVGERVRRVRDPLRTAGASRALESMRWWSEHASAEGR